MRVESVYHLTYMDTQLSKVTGPLPLIPRASWRGFKRTDRTHRLHLTAFGVGIWRTICRVLYYYESGVSPSRRQVSQPLVRQANLAFLPNGPVGCRVKVAAGQGLTIHPYRVLPCAGTGVAMKETLRPV